MMETSVWHLQHACKVLLVHYCRNHFHRRAKTHFHRRFCVRMYAPISTGGQMTSATACGKGISTSGR
uniref:Uncharacterized protein n=1 Tax=Arundo donax TaxID=35708 RepID=A0A0A8ZLZ2_ARUDO